MSELMFSQARREHLDRTRELERELTERSARRQLADRLGAHLGPLA